MIRTWKISRGLCIPAPALDGYTTLDEVSMNLPQGVYTTFRTFCERNRVFDLSGHFQRLSESAQLTGWQGELDEMGVRSGLRALLAGWPGGECRVRITLDLTQDQGCVFVTLTTFEGIPPEIYTCGVLVRISAVHRPAPEVKSTTFITKTHGLKSQQEADVFEWLIESHGRILEGLTSNFFGIVQGVLYTAGSGVLGGITRQAVLGLAAKQGIPIEMSSILVANLGQLQEAFITSSSRGVIPVVKIDEQVIGNGTPGLLTQQLGQAYADYVNSVVEAI